MKQSSDYTRITTTETITTMKMEARVRMYVCACVCALNSQQTINIFSSHMISGRKCNRKREREAENVLCVRRYRMHIANMSCLWLTRSSQGLRAHYQAATHSARWQFPFAFTWIYLESSWCMVLSWCSCVSVCAFFVVFCLPSSSDSFSFLPFVNLLACLLLYCCSLCQNHNNRYEKHYSIKP